MSLVQKNEYKNVHEMELEVHSQSKVNVLQKKDYKRYVLKLSDLYRSVNWVAKSDPEYL